MSDSADLFFADLLMVPCFLMYFRTFFLFTVSTLLYETKLQMTTIIVFVMLFVICFKPFQYKRCEMPVYDSSHLHRGIVNFGSSLISNVPSSGAIALLWLDGLH